VSPKTRSAAPTEPWARDDWVNLLGRLTDGFVRSVPAGGSPARAILPGAPPDDPVSSIEGFARMAVAWAAWVGQPANPGLVAGRGREHDIPALLAQGLADATDPAHPAWWGPIGDRDQRIVEAAEIATAIWLGGERLRSALDRLDPAAFGRVLDWLSMVDGCDVWPDNWVLFPMLSRLVRRANGRAVDLAAIDAAVDWMLDHDAGDGWTSDGAGHALDLYSGWAIHWHLLWWAVIDGRRRPAVRRRVIRRARAWLRFVAAAIAPDGSYPRFGRSLGYRFAIAAPFAQAGLAGIDPLPPGVARRLTGSVVRRALLDGAIDDATDWFRVGVGGERPSVVERYVSAGAVAWAAHAFVALGLPASDPFWAAAEDPVGPRRRVAGEAVASRAGLLVTWDGGATTLHNARTGHPEDIADHDYAATYGKLAYRSGHPFDVPITAATSAGSDDALVVLEDTSTGELRIAHRNESSAGLAGPGWLRSAYRLPTTSPTTVRTVVLVMAAVEVRLSAVRASAAVRFRDGGPVLGGRTEPRCIETLADMDPPVAAVEDGGRLVAIRGLAGFDRAGATGASPGRMNLMHDAGRHPWVEESVARSGSRLLASAIVAGDAGEPARRALAAVRLDRLGPAVVRVTCGDPRMIAVVTLSPRAPGDLVVAGRAFHGRLGIAIAGEDGAVFRGDRIAAVDGVVRLARPGMLAIARFDGAVEATSAAGLAVDRGWAGRGFRWVSFGDGAWPFGDPIRLAESGVVPDTLVRQATRSAGTSLVTMRLDA
jgi:hypothetical protein